MAKSDYTEDNIKTREWVPHIRKRPGMYIGEIGDGNGYHDCVYVRSVREDEYAESSFKEGVLVCSKRGKCAGHEPNGTLVRYMPDATCLKKYKMREDHVRRRIQMYAYVNPGLKLVLNGVEYTQPGGLLNHSLNVYDEALVIRESQLKFRPELDEKLPVASIAIAALLHDVCKAEVYKEVEKFRKDKDGKWEKYTTYGVDYSTLPLGHGEKSVIRLLRWGLELTDDEILAIRWHMQGFDLSDSPEAKGCFTAAGDKCPLLAILIAADGLASRILETNN